MKNDLYWIPCINAWKNAAHIPPKIWPLSAAEYFMLYHPLYPPLHWRGRIHTYLYSSDLILWNMGTSHQGTLIAENSPWRTEKNLCWEFSTHQKVTVKRMWYNEFSPFFSFSKFRFIDNFFSFIMLKKWRFLALKQKNKEVCSFSIVISQFYSFKFDILFKTWRWM